ncbi:MAG: methyltransferase [Pseudomonadota bacterium]
MTTVFTEADLTHDAFLGGLLQLYQPRKGYRAGADAVLLAAAIPATAGQRVLELGCGVGTASLCLAARVPGVQITGVEREPAYAELARRNGGKTFEVVTTDLADMPLHLRMRQFDHVLANPPFYDRAASVRSRDPMKEAAQGVHTPLKTWVKVAAKRLAPKGNAHFVHLMERLPDLLRALPNDLGSVEVLPLAAREGRVPERFILRARKNGRGAFCLHPTLILHEGLMHEDDGDSFTPVVRAVLRAGSALRF